MRVYVDLETSGLNPDVHQVLEVGAVTSGAREASFCRLVRPTEATLDDLGLENSLSVSRLSLDSLMAASTIEIVAKEFRSWLGNLQECGRVQLHAYNNEFDARFLEREPWSLARSEWGECVMVAASNMVDPWRRRFVKLSRAAEYFELQWEGAAHRALSDARMARAVYEAVLARRAVFS